MRKRTMIVLGGCALILLVLLLIFIPKCKEAIHNPGNIWHHIFHITKPIPDPVDADGKPDVLHVTDPKPLFEVGEVSVGPGETVILVPIDGDSTTFQQVKIPIHGSGKIHLYIDPRTGRLVTSQDRFGFDLAFTAGPSIHGFEGGLETFFINDFLGTTTIHAVTPALEVSVWNEDRGDVYAGLGISAEIWPKHTPLRLQGAYEWFIEDLRQSRITFGATIPLAF